MFSFAYNENLTVLCFWLQQKKTFFFTFVVGIKCGGITWANIFANEWISSHSTCLEKILLIAVLIFWVLHVFAQFIAFYLNSINAKKWQNCEWNVFIKSEFSRVKKNRRSVAFVSFLFWMIILRRMIMGCAMN